MNILLIEPFFGSSHKKWVDELTSFLPFNFELLTLPGKFWKWRMHGAAITLAQQFNASNFQPDIIVATDFLDLSTFLALTRKKTSSIPTAVFFHENQFAYPLSEADPDVIHQRDNHYGFINYTSALSADFCLFNSAYNANTFLTGIEQLLQKMPDNKNWETINVIRDKVHVVGIGIDLQQLDTHKPSTLVANQRPLLLWNHRWEFDKNPLLFFETLFELKSEGIPFELAVLGEEVSPIPPIFDQARKYLQNEIVQWGFAPTRQAYVEWLWKADILPVTSWHDFFGVSVIEAIYCQTLPLLPNRLAYPEHFSAAEFDVISFEHELEFKAQLKQLVRAYPKKHSIPDVSRYDWSIMSEKYQNAFEKVANSRKNNL